MSKTGVVNTWVEDRGYGFISPHDSNLCDLFLHVDNIADRNVKGFKRGDKVRFDVEVNTNPTKNCGKKLAINVSLASTGGRDRRDRDRREDGRRSRCDDSREKGRERGNGRPDSREARRSAGGSTGRRRLESPVRGSGGGRGTRGSRGRNSRSRSR
mmetsp:Transcript_81114/g.225678  ORF Transcript_81114/g.225678 Transcript_81114/m.225678 type:complete len:156 (+) Transcript_81114:96-563(+)